MNAASAGLVRLSAGLCRWQTCFRCVSLREDNMLKLHKPGLLIQPTPYIYKHQKHHLFKKDGVWCCTLGRDHGSNKSYGSTPKAAYEMRLAIDSSSNDISMLLFADHIRNILRENLRR
jgi:hypothetical protein